MTEVLAQVSFALNVKRFHYLLYLFFGRLLDIHLLSSHYEDFLELASFNNSVTIHIYHTERRFIYFVQLLLISSQLLPHNLLNIQI